MASDLLFKACIQAKEYDLTTNQVIVLLMLCNHVNPDSGQCNPSRETLAACTKLSERSVSRAIVELEEKGFITCFRHKRMSTQYRVSLPNFTGQSVSSEGTHSPVNGKTRDRESRLRGQSVSSEGTECPVRGDTVARKTIKETTNETTNELLKEGEGQKTTFKDLCLTELPSSWLDWIVEAHPDFLPERAFEMFNNFWLEKRSKKTPQEWFERFKLSTDGIPASRIDWVCGRPTKKQTTRKSGHKAYRQPDHVATFEEMGLI